MKLETTPTHTQTHKHTHTHNVSNIKSKSGIKWAKQSNSKKKDQHSLKNKEVKIIETTDTK